MADQSQTITWTNQTTAYTVTGAPSDAPAVVIANDTNVAIYARNDGTAASAGPGSIVIEPGAEWTLDNTLPLQNPNQGTYYCGAEKTFSQSESVNWTAQTGLVADSLSLFPSNTTNSGTITVTFQ